MEYRQIILNIKAHVSCHNVRFKKPHTELKGPVDMWALK